MRTYVRTYVAVGYACVNNHGHAVCAGDERVLGCLGLKDSVVKGLSDTGGKRVK